MISLELTEEQKNLQEAAIAFARESLSHDMIARDREAHFDRDAWRRCAEFGVLGHADSRRSTAASASG